MFNTGDAVIHPNLGAGIVRSIKNIVKKGKQRQFYRIEIVGKTRTKVLVPADKIEQLGIRAAIAPDELDKIWDILSSVADELPDDNKLRKNALDQRLHNAQTYEYATLVRDITWRKLQGKTIHAPSRSALERAMTFLVGEMAITQNAEIESVRSNVEHALEANLTPRLVLSEIA